MNQQLTWPANDWPTLEKLFRVDFTGTLVLLQNGTGGRLRLSRQTKLQPDDVIIIPKIWRTVKLT